MHGMGSRGRIAAATAFLLFSAATNVAATDRTGGGDSDPLKLRTASVFEIDEVLPFVNAVTDVSEGSITLDVDESFAGGRPEDEAAVIDAVRAGTADIGLIGSRGLHDAGVPSFDALQAPFLIASYEQEAAVLQSPVIDEMAAATAASGLAIVGVV